MGIENHADQLGPPDIKLDRLQIWIHGRQFPDATDYWDGNWLRITAHCGSSGADVWTSGPILNLPALVNWLADLEHLSASMRGEASLVPMEPELLVTLTAEQHGKILVEVEITPDHTQEHTFNFELNQSYLAPLIASCRKILAEYPVRGTPAE